MKLNRGRFMNLITKPHVLTDESTALPNLFDSTDQWRSLFERSTLGVAMIDLEFHFLTANPAFLTMFGYSCQELKRLSFLDICIDETLDQCRGHLRELSEGVRLHYEIETQHRRKDGTFLPVNTYFSAVSERRPNQRRFLTVTVDISARRAAEDALRAAQSELGRVARLTTVGAMAATIAHEINQPLAAIVSNGGAGLRWLNRPDPNLEEARSAFGRVVKDGHRAAQIITSIRAMFKKDSGTRSPVATNELVCDVVSTLLGELKSHRVSLTLQLLEDLAPVQADRVQLQQVLLNLLTNAIDAMAVVTDRPHTLCVRSEHLEDWVLVSVQDFGTGIAPEHAERMFDAFFTTKPNGIGLGLSICRSIVGSHGGRMSVFPAHPHGSVFQVMLPIGEADAEHHQPAEASPSRLRSASRFNLEKIP